MNKYTSIFFLLLFLLTNLFVEIETYEVCNDDTGREFICKDYPNSTIGFCCQPDPTNVYYTKCCLRISTNNELLEWILVAIGIIFSILLLWACNRWLSKKPRISCCDLLTRRSNVVETNEVATASSNNNNNQSAVATVSSSNNEPVMTMSELEANEKAIEEEEEPPPAYSSLYAYDSPFDQPPGTAEATTTC